MDIIKTLSQELNLNESRVKNVVELIDGGNTIPFIARYRKEVTGSMDDATLRDLNDRLTYLRHLNERREEILSAIEAQGKLTDELREAIERATVLVELEDLYRPYKAKKKTRASVARERGLEPLSEFILMQGDESPEAEALKYIDEEKGVKTAADAIAGACDIIAENLSDDAALRRYLRSLITDMGSITTKNIAENQVYKNYYDYSEPVRKIASHRVLAINRGEAEEILKVSIKLPEGVGERACVSRLKKGDNACSKLVEAACLDAYKRLIYPSVEREVRAALSDTAHEGAIKVFSKNLRELLLQPPIKDCVTLGLDPAYRTGCKIAVVDGTGRVLDTTVVYPTPPQNKIEEAERVLKRMIEHHGVTLIAIGNGTASRESEQFVAGLLPKLAHTVHYMVVSEAGASVYSASKLASEEFPQFDVAQRSAVSIARRLQDPLSELVKIEPCAIGVGQYQHDMPKNRLEGALSGVVEDCVNSVGVDLNTASHSLLNYVSGINATVAKNIVTYREQNGAFKTRKELLKVPKLGEKAYEQCAGFLRIIGGKNPLDSTAVHPESYRATEAILKELSIPINDVRKGVADIDEKVKIVGVERLSEVSGVGEQTMADILSELKKPGRDIRDDMPKPLLRDANIMELSDLKPGMELVGTVRNVIDFGAFVDIGVHEDGLVHISQITDRFIKHPSEVLKVGDILKVRVLDVDMQRKRISLTLKGVSK